MASDLLSSPLLTWLLITAGTSAVAWVIFVVSTDPEHHFTSSLIVIALATLGSTVGILGGISREGVVGQLVPAVLGLIGAGAVYMFVFDEKKAATVSLTVTVFSVSLFLSYLAAAHMRTPVDRLTFWRDRCVTIYSDMERARDHLIDQNFGLICGLVIDREAMRMGINPVTGMPIRQ